MVLKTAGHRSVRMAMLSQPHEPDSQPVLLDALTPVHVEVLALRAAGVADDDVAALIGVPVESVEVLVRVASRKVRRLLNTTGGRGGRNGDGKV